MPVTSGLADRCASLTALGTEPLVCSREALAHVLRSVGYEQIGNLIGLAAFLALPSVVLMMLFGQTRIFFVMWRSRRSISRPSAISITRSIDRKSTRLNSSH